MQRVRVLVHSALGWRRLMVGTYLVGRSEDCDIVVVSSRASRKHAQIVVTEVGATLVDLSSANGTYVNGARIDRAHDLHNDDFVVIGDGALDVVLEPDEGASRVPVLELRSEAPETAPHQAAALTAPPSADSTLGAREGEAPDRWIEAWADGVLAQLGAGTLRDEAARRSAMRFGVELAVNRGNPRRVDFVLQLAAHGIPLPLDRARALCPAIERFGIGAAVLAAYLATLRSLEADNDRQALLSLAEGWQASVRRS